jgi:hypothetical protein
MRAADNRIRDLPVRLHGGQIGVQLQGQPQRDSGLHRPNPLRPTLAHDGAVGSYCSIQLDEGEEKMLFLDDEET